MKYKKTQKNSRRTLEIENMIFLNIWRKHSSARFVSIRILGNWKENELKKLKIRTHPKKPKELRIEYLF